METLQRIDYHLDEEVVNRVYRPWYACDRKYMILFGGAGSGKSVFAAQKKVNRCMEMPDERFLVVRKVGRTLRRSCFQLLKDVVHAAGLGPYTTIRETEMELHFPNGSSLLCTGIDDPEKIKSIARVSGVWIEEATELNEEDFDQIDLRLRGETPSYKQIILSYNPIQETHWLKRRFHDAARVSEDGNTAWGDDCGILRTTYLDNDFIDPEYRDKLDRLREINPEYYQIYGLGEWATPQSAIYPNWRFAPSWPEGGESVFGIDFAFSVPTAVTEVKHHEGNIYVRELLYREKMTNGDLIEELKTLIPTRTTPIYADAAEPNRIEEIYRAGFNIHAADKSVSSGIDFVKRFPLYIDPDSPNLLKEIRSYQYRKDRNGNVLDEPVKFADHLCDALRYAAYTHGKVYWNTHAAQITSLGSRKTSRGRRSPLLTGF